MPRSKTKPDTITARIRCKKVRFDPVKDTDNLSRIHVWDCLSAMDIPDDIVAGMFDKQAEMIEKAKGIERLPFPNNDEDPPAE